MKRSNTMQRAPTNLDTMGSGSGILIAAAFFGWVSVTLIVGAQGPDVFVMHTYMNPMAEIVPDDPDKMERVKESWDKLMDQQDAKDEALRNSGTTIEYTRTNVLVTGLERKNQVLYIQAQVEKPGWGNPVLEGLDLSFEQDVAVWHSAYHEDIHLICDMVTEAGSEDQLRASGHSGLPGSHDDFQSGNFVVQSKATFSTGFASGAAFTTRHNHLFALAIVRTLGSGITMDQIRITAVEVAGGAAPGSATKTVPSIPTLPTPAPTSPPRMTKHMVVCGSAGGCGANASYSAFDFTTHEARCCADTKPAGSGWQKGKGETCNVWAAQFVPQSSASTGFDCEHALTWGAASSMCNSINGRLCTQAELEADCGRGTGCGHDTDHVWASDRAASESVPVEVSYEITDLSQANATAVENIINDAAEADECKRYCKGVLVYFNDEVVRGSLTYDGQPALTMSVSSRAAIKSQPAPFWQQYGRCKSMQAKLEDEAQEAEVFKVYTHAGAHRRQVHCPPNQQFCDPMTLFFSHYVEHSSYRLEVAFRHPGLLYLQQLNDTALWDDEHKQAVPFNSWSSNFKVQFNAFHVNAEYTEFEMGWKYAYLFFNIVVGIWYLCGLCQQKCCRLSVHSKHQRWVLALFVALFFANDPFFAAKFEPSQSASRADGITTFHIISLCCFILMLMTFWLECFEDMAALNDTPVFNWKGAKDGKGGSESGRARAPGQMNVGDDYGGGGAGFGKLDDGADDGTMGEKAQWFCGPRTVAALIFFLCLTILLCYERLRTAGDPTYNSQTDMKHYTALYAIGVLLVTLYAIYLLRIFALCFQQIKQMSYLALVLLMITCASIFATVVGVYANALSPLETAAVAFLGFYSVFNTYVFVIAICYRPSGAQPAGPTARDREHFEQAASLQHGAGRYGDRLDDDEEDDEEEDEQEVELELSAVPKQDENYV